MDEMARALGLDPLEFRQRNALRDGDTKPDGEALDDVHLLDVLQRVAALSKWRQGKPRTSANGVVRGRGIALGDRHIGIGESAAEILVEPDGSLRLATAVRDVGVGAYTCTARSPPKCSASSRSLCRSTSPAPTAPTIREYGRSAALTSKACSLPRRHRLERAVMRAGRASLERRNESGALARWPGAPQGIQKKPRPQNHRGAFASRIVASSRPLQA